MENNDLPFKPFKYQEALIRQLEEQVRDGVLVRTVWVHMGKPCPQYLFRLKLNPTAPYIDEDPSDATTTDTTK